MVNRRLLTSNYNIAFDEKLKIQNMKTIKNLLLFGSLIIAGKAFAQETRKIPAFSKLEIGGSFDAVLRQGNETSVKITAENIDTKKFLLNRMETLYGYLLKKDIIIISEL